jgi:hypothetical protein
MTAILIACPLSVCPSVCLTVFLSNCMPTQISFFDFFLSVYRPVRLSISTSVTLSVYLVFLSILSFCLSVFLSFCLSAFLSFCLSVFLSFCLSVIALKINRKIAKYPRGPCFTHTTQMLVFKNKTLILVIT